MLEIGNPGNEQKHSPSRSRERSFLLVSMLLFDFAGICGAPAAHPRRSLFIASYFRKIRGVGKSCWAVQEIAALSNENAQLSCVKGSMIACDATILVLSRFRQGLFSLYLGRCSFESDSTLRKHMLHMYYLDHDEDRSFKMESVA